VKRRKTYLRLTFLVSILFGIILPLAVGVKDPTLIAITFSSVWFLYIVVMMVVVFLLRPGLKIKVIRQKNPTIVRYELSDSTREK
jgi:ABC-type transport system involved in Fe-S cluster assembly fused permease/ATPase subunit